MPYIKKLGFFIALLIFYLVLVNIPTSPSSAQGSPCASDPNNPRAQGLVSTGDFDPNSVFTVTNQGSCITDSASGSYSVAIDNFLIPTYTSLENQYYIKSKVPKITINTNPLANAAYAAYQLFQVTGDIEITTSPTYDGNATNETKVIFVRGSLNIKDNIIWHSAPTDKPGGLVFVVRDNINIDYSVTKIDAVLISFGNICSGFDFDTSLCQTIKAPQLVVNGSFISLKAPDPNAPPAIKLVRDLGDNSQPAEKINWQEKYLVLLKDLMADDLRITTEDTFFGEDIAIGGGDIPPVPPPPGAPPPVTPDTTPPNPPTGLSANAISSSAIVLTWNNNGTDNIKLWGYNLFRSTDNTNFTKINSTPITPSSTNATTVSYTASGLAASTIYYFKVQSVDTSNNVSSLTSAIQISTQALQGTTLTVNRNVVDPGETVTVTWRSVPNATVEDWIGLFPSTYTGDQTNSKLYTSTCNSPLPPAGSVAKASGSCTFTLPLSLPASQYEMRLYRNTTPTKTLIVTSNTFTASGSAYYLSDLSWEQISNGFGPAEKNAEIGDVYLADGAPLSVRGIPYAKGLGVHPYNGSPSEIRFDTQNKCSGFTGEVGLSDSPSNPTQGSVVFQIWGDSTLLYNSGVMRITDSQRTKTFRVDLSGKQTLKLIVTDGGDGWSWDHGAWLNPRITCSGTPKAPKITPSTRTTSAGEVLTVNWENMIMWQNYKGNDAKLSGYYWDRDDNNSTPDDAYDYDLLAEDWIALYPVGADNSRPVNDDYSYAYYIRSCDWHPGQSSRTVTSGSCRFQINPDTPVGYYEIRWMSGWGEPSFDGYPSAVARSQSIYVAPQLTVSPTNILFEKDTDRTLTKGLVSYWKMDETSAPDAADSYGGNHGAAHQLVVRAKATLNNNLGPHMMIKIGGTTYMDTYVQSSGWIEFAAPANLATGSQSVQIFFDNDACCTNGDRNLYIDRISYGNSVLEAENLTVGPAVAECYGGTGCATNYRFSNNDSESNGYIKITDNVNNSVTVTGNLNINNYSSASLKGSGKNFNGLSDFFRVVNNNSINQTRGFTISAWIRPNTVTGFFGIASKITGSNDKQYALSIEDGRLQFDYERSGNDWSIETTNLLTPAAWQHVAVTVSNSSPPTVKLYINGTERASGTAPAETSKTGSWLFFGKWAEGYQKFYYNGLMDEIGFWNRALNSQEISDLCNLSGSSCTGNTFIPPTITNPVDEGALFAYWKGVPFPTTDDWLELMNNLGATKDWFYVDTCTKTEGTRALGTGSCLYQPADIASGAYNLDFWGHTSTSWYKAATSNTLTFTQTPYTSAISIPGKIEAENFDKGGQGIAYNDYTIWNSGNAYRNSAVDIQGTSDAGGGYNIGWLNQFGEWLEYTINVATTGNYNITARTATTGNSGGLNQVTVRAKGDSYNGDSHMIVKVNGTTVINTYVTPGEWNYYTGQIVLNPGTYPVQIIFDNDLCCGPNNEDRNIHIDYVNVANARLEAENLSGCQSQVTDNTKSGGKYCTYFGNTTNSGNATIENRPSFHIEVDGVDKTGPMGVPNTGDWQIFSNVTKNLVNLTAGQHVLRFHLDDSSNNGVNLNYIDIVPSPPLSVSCSPNPASPQIGQQVTWTATPNGGSYSYTSYSWLIDGSTSTGQSVSRTFNTTGTKTARVTVTDSTGATAQSPNCNINVTPDTTPPNVSLTSPTNGSTVSRYLTLNATASDLGGIAGVRFYYNNNLITDDTSSPYSVIWDSFAVPNGSVTLRAEARDATGNTNSNSITVTIDNFYRVFVTSTSYNGNLGGFAGADAKCNAAAADANLGGTWRAWLSDNSTTQAKDRISTYPGYNQLLSIKKLNNVAIANNFADLIDGTIASAINRYEYNFQTIKNYNVWTKTTQYGTIHTENSYDCNVWTNPTSTGGNPRRGSTDSITDNWTTSGHTGCNNALKLYCFEVSSQPNPAPPAPQGPVKFTTQPYGTGNSDSSLRIAFKTNVCPSSYDVYYRKHDTTTFSVNSNITTGCDPATLTTNYTIGGLTDQTIYYYYVVVKDSAGNGTKSGVNGGETASSS